MKTQTRSSLWLFTIAALVIGAAVLASTTFNRKPATVKAERDEGRNYDQPDEAAAFYRLKRLPDGATELPVERYLEAQEQMREMPLYSSAKQSFVAQRAEQMRDPRMAEALERSAWLNLGPGNIGGRTRALLISPAEPTLMYAAGVAGGVWRTTDGGHFWEPLADMIANIAVNSLAMEPRNAFVLYAGTGEGFNNADSTRGAGIFKTIDGGARWERLSGTDNPDFHYVNDIVVSPNDNRHVYAATRAGIFRSTDGGTSWTRVHNPNVTAGCLDLVIRTDQTTDYLFAACGNFEQATIYRNTNAAGTGTWTPVKTEAGMGRTSLALAPSNQNVIYALSAKVSDDKNLNYSLHAVFRSTSSGDPNTWTARVSNTGAFNLNTVLLTNPRGAFFKECFDEESSFSNQGFYDNVIAVDPRDENRAWAGGIDLFRSDDGGANWGIASYWDKAVTNSDYAHADQHAIVFHPDYDGVDNRVMFVGNDGGIFRTLNARAQTATGKGARCRTTSLGINWTNLNHNYGVTQFYHGAVYPDGRTFLGGTQDNGTIHRSSAMGTDGWVKILGGDGGYVAVAPDNPNILYAENTGRSIQRSDDGGKKFTGAINGITESGDNFLFIAPFTIDPSNSKRLWTGGKTIWRTSDGAKNWEQASAELSGGQISAIAVAPSNSNRVLVGTSGGSVYRQDKASDADEKTSWDSTKPRDGYVSWLSVDPVNEKIAYATYSPFGGKHVWKSTDAGASWTPIDGVGSTGIPDIPVHCLIVDPNNTRRLYVGTDLGVFVSVDGGENWAVENTGFANVVTESLAVNSLDNKTNLFAFTHGRGAWRVEIEAQPTDLAVSVSAPASVVTCNTLTYTMTVRNNGPNPASQINLKSELATNATFSLPPFDCKTPEGGGGVCNIQDNRLTAIIPFLEVNASAAITFTIEADSRLADGQFINNSVAVTSAATDPNPGNNSASSVTRFVNPAPVINNASVSENILPPDGRLHRVIVGYNVTDNCPAGISNSLSVGRNPAYPLSMTIVPVPREDVQILDNRTVLLRAVPDDGCPRHYVITITSRDSGGATSSRKVFVKVPLP